MIHTKFNEFINENKSKEDLGLIYSLQNELDTIQKWIYKNKDSDKWIDYKESEKEYYLMTDKATVIRKKLKDLTGNSCGILKSENSVMKKPKDLDKEYNSPYDVPKSVYKWIDNNYSLLYSDATDAVRWFRIINSKFNDRYLKGDLEIYRAVDNNEYNEIRPGDWITTDRKYAEKHLNKYFKNGKILSDIVDGRDVLKSPTGNYEEAIYAPMELSIDVEY